MSETRAVPTTNYQGDSDRVTPNPILISGIDKALSGYRIAKEGASCRGLHARTPWLSMGKERKPVPARKPAKPPSRERVRSQWPLRGAAAAGTVAVLALVVRILLPPRTPAVAREVPEMRSGEFVETSCNARDYHSLEPGCSPKRCGRLVIDDFVDGAELAGLLHLAKKGMAVTRGGSGGPTILDLQSGALSFEDKFIDVWYAFNMTGRRPITRSEAEVYRRLTERVAATARETFGAAELWLTAPTFFSRISADRPPIIDNDQYWHTHVDRTQYGSFVFTALLYLASQGDDFEGGAFRFDSPKTGEPVATVRPRAARLALFTSGHEHPHHIEEVTAGSRLALTIAFTCDRDAAIVDFLGRAAPDADAVAREEGP